MENKTIKLELNLKSFHSYYLNRFIILVQKYFKDLNMLTVIQQNFEKKQVEYFTVLRSPHVDKKARDQFERRTYARKICLEFKKGHNLQKHNELIFLTKILCHG